MVGRRSFGKWIFRSLKVFCGGGTQTRMMSSSLSPPWLMLPPASEGGDMVYKFYSVAENRVLSLKKRSSGIIDHDLEIKGIIDDDLEIKGSSHGWLCLFNRRNCDLFLTNPVSGRHIKLPSIHTLAIPEVNLQVGSWCVSKVILSGCPDANDNECRAMMAYAANRLAFCCPGQSMWWTPIGSPNYYEEFVYSSRHKLFFCLTGIPHDELEGWDLSHPRSPRLEWLDNGMVGRFFEPWSLQREELELETGMCIMSLRYLVFAEQSNQLYMVTRYLVQQITLDGSPVDINDDEDYPCKTIGFNVHKIDRQGRKVVFMEGSLDGLAMFVGDNHSFAISAAKFPQLKPNSIYFTSDSQNSDWVEGMYGGHDIGIFDYEKRTISPCYYPCDVQSFKWIMPAPIWFTPSPH